MTRRMLAAAVMLWAFAATGRAEDLGVRLLLGVTDIAATPWDGSAEAAGARIASIEPWRFETADAIEGISWRCSTRPIRLFAGANAPPRPVVANGVIVWLTGASSAAALHVKTAQGNFTVRLAEIPYGARTPALNGRVLADRVPPAERVTSSPEEEDYPAAAAAPSGEVWLVYVQFRHNPDHDRLRANLKAPPADLRAYTTPPGGDQIFARKLSGDKWGDPIAVTPPGGDLYRPAVAVDGRGRAWVFWSANTGRAGEPNFDLWASAVDVGRARAPVRITTEPGSDMDPVAARDSAGRVWVAWQSWRGGRASIFAAVQEEEAFSAPVRISRSGANEWNPAIAADAAGRVTIAYDSYRNGNYDVFFRTYSGGKWGAEVAAAAKATYEAYPSIAYEPGGRLWLAYEEGAERWGKDMGSYESTGVALYQGRAVRLRGWEPDGRVVEPAADPGIALPGVAAPRADSTSRQSDSEDWLVPDPGRWKRRAPSQAIAHYVAPRNTTPRLHVDPSGRIWLAVRSNHPLWWNPLGTVWSEHVASYDGKAWTGPLWVAHSDNLLDNRPALVSTSGGKLYVLGASDSRGQFQLSNAAEIAAIVRDPYNNDLYRSVVELAPGSGTIPVRASQAPPAAAPSADVRGEQASIAAMRAARLLGKYRVVRGEFHRHSDVSHDGGNDGSLLDQWRYALDTADMDWIGCCDHDNGGGREYTWWLAQKLTDIFHTPGRFVAMFSYERGIRYPEGHRNVVFAQRGVRVLPRLPTSSAEVRQSAPDTRMLYDYLRTFGGVVASHTSATSMGTDWRDNDPDLEPAVEIYQGVRQSYEMAGAPRANSEQDSIGGWRPDGLVSLALEKGYKLAFEASSDHTSTHMSYCNILAPSLTREALLEAFHLRHVYAATDNILAEVRSGGHVMGDAFTTSTTPELRVKLLGTAPFAKVHVIKDNRYVYTAQPNRAAVELTWRDTAAVRGSTSYYYVRGEQADGEIVWVSPMWITYAAK